VDILKEKTPCQSVRLSRSAKEHKYLAHSALHQIRKVGQQAFLLVG